MPVRTAYLALGLVALFWSGNSIIGRAVAELVPPLTLALGRWVGAFLLLLPFAGANLARDIPTLRRHWRMTLLLGTLGVGLFNALLYSGLHVTTASNALLIQALNPALILIFGGLLFGDRVGPAGIAATALSLAGVVVILLHGDPGRLPSFRFNAGDALIACAAVCWAAYSVLLRRRPPVAPVSFLAATFAIGIVVSLPAAGIEYAMGRRIVWVPTVLGAFAYVAILPSLIGYLLFNGAVATLGSARAGQVTNLMPPFGALLAALVLGEPLHGYHALGLLLILLGIVGFFRAEPSPAKVTA